MKMHCCIYSSRHGPGGDFWTSLNTELRTFQSIYVPMYYKQYTIFNLKPVSFGTLIKYWRIGIHELLSDQYLKTLLRRLGRAGGKVSRHTLGIIIIILTYHSWESRRFPNGLDSLHGIATT